MNQRAINGGGTVTPVQEPGLLQRLRAAYQYVSTGRSDWFGPRDPMPPVAPQEVKEQGRALDYMTGYNQNLSPRALEPVSFSHLRTLADAYDLMRLIIETRKDQVSRMKWNVKPRDPKQQADSRCDKINQFLRSPDREHDWDTWLRALLEDMLVIDAATIYPRRTRGGELYSLDLIDGATIKRVIGQDGRVPMPPDPAYQQVLKGVPAANFTADELLYRVRNWRVHRIYGYSPVEQVITTVNIALRRQMHQLQYYTEGNVPEALIGVPENWTTEQIRQFQAYWDDLMEGNTAKRRHAKFVPGGMEYQPTKDSVLKDMYDEWLVRIVCFAFSVSPNAFVTQVNRATAEVSQRAAMEEGLGPVMQWVKGTMDTIIARYFGAPDLEFDWVEEVNLDPETKSRIHATYIGAGVLTPDEVREELGRDPLTPEERELLAAKKPSAGEPPPDERGEGGEEGDEAKGAYLGNLAKRSAARPKAARPVAPINRERRAVKKAERLLRGAIEAWLADCLAEALEATAEIGKAVNEGQQIADALKLAGLDALADALAEIFMDLVKDAGRQALTQVNVDDAAILALVNERAVAWAREHAAELVGKKWVDGVLVDNPNAAYRIDQVTREGVRSLVEQAINEGWSNDRLADALRNSYAFSKERADLIAATETAFADVAGNMIAYEESGVVSGKRWIVGNQPVVCDACTENAAQGVIPFKQPFASGHMAPPGHPRCFLPGTLVSAGGVSAHYKRWFEGEIVRVLIEGNDALAVTPNHPILTRRGWVAAGELREGDYVLKVLDEDAFVRVAHPQNHHVKALIEEVGGALGMAGGVMTVGVPLTAKDFHGDGAGSHDVDVVWANGRLDAGLNASLVQAGHDLGLVITDAQLELFACGGDALTLQLGLNATTGGAVRVCSSCSALLGSGPHGLDAHGVRCVPDGQEQPTPLLAERAAMTAEQAGKVYAALASHVAFVKVEKVIAGEQFAGHVYNLETDGGWYVANSIIAHNCRCDVLPVTKKESRA